MKAPKVLREWIKPSRNENICDCCGGVINVGERYVRQDLIDPDTKEKWIWRSHVECDNLTLHLPKRFHLEGFTKGDFVSFTMSYANQRHCNGCPYYYKDAVCKSQRSAHHCAPYVRKWIEEGIRRKMDKPKVSNSPEDIGDMMR